MSCDNCDAALPANGEYVVCSNCKSNLHFKCSGLLATTWSGMSTKSKSAWRCVKCRNANKNKESAERRDSDDPAVCSALLLLKDEIASLSKQVVTLQSTVSSNNEKLDSALLLINKLREENEVLNVENSLLKTQLADLEQYTRSNNLILSNVPVTKSENVTDVVRKIGDLAGIKIVETDIDCCHRLRKTQKQLYPDIIVKFCRRTIKQSLFSNRRSPQLSHRDLGFGETGSNSKIFINEHLTAQNVKLLNAAKMVKNHGYKFVWSRNGRIFVRQQENSPVIPILSAVDIANLVKHTGSAAPG